MLQLETYVPGLATAAGKLTYRRLVLGDERHPAKMERTAAPPRYAQVFEDTDDFIEAAWMVAGKCVMTINGKSYLLRAGDCCVINRGVRHFESYRTENTGYEIVWFSHRNIAELLINNARYSTGGGYEFISHLMTGIQPEWYRFLEDIFTVSEPRKQPGLVRERIASWLKAVGENVKQGHYTKKVHTEKTRYETALKARKIGPAVEYVKKRYQEKLTLPEVAGQVGLSPSHFCVLFKEVYEMSLFEFIISLRLKEACRLLKTTELHVNEISPRVGYNDPYFFSRIFSRWFGISPARFRERVFPRLFITDPYYDNT